MAQKGSGSTPHGRPGGDRDDGGRPPGNRDPRRENPEVYRRRRLAAALVAGLLVLLVAGGLLTTLGSLLGPDGAPEAAAPEAAAPATSQEPFADFTPRPGASGSASATGRPAGECGAELVVSGSTDRESYREEERPVLVLTLENTGEEPCRVDAGTSRMVYRVSSGADTVFDSRHCQVGSEDREVTLEPGQEESARLPWGRVRTAEGCAAAGGEVQPGYYSLVVALGERTGEPVPFVLE